MIELLRRLYVPIEGSSKRRMRGPISGLSRWPRDVWTVRVFHAFLLLTQFRIYISECGIEHSICRDSECCPTHSNISWLFSTNWHSEGCSGHIIYASRYTCKEQQISRQQAKSFRRQKSIKTALSYDLFISMCHPYIESATTLSDNNNNVKKKINPT